MRTRDECQQNGAFIHGQDHPGPAVTSFFKIMISDDFMRTLYLPPQVAKATSHLADQEIYLEDSVGIRSKAKVSTWKNMLAIHHGWDQFSLNHNIERGDFLVFHYFTRPVDHFVVHIYGRSGCLKNDFDTTPIDRSSKRARTINSSLRPECESKNGKNNKSLFPCNPGGETEGINVNAANKESPATLGNNDYQPKALGCSPIIDEGINQRKESCPPSLDVEEQNVITNSFTMSKNDLSCKSPSACAPIIDEAHNKEKESCPPSMDVEKLFQMSKNELCSKSPSDGKLRSQENERVQLGPKGALPSRLEMPTSKPFERKIISLGERDSMEHVQGKDNSVKNKSITESLMPHVIKMGHCTNSIQMPITQFGGAFGNGEKAKFIKKEPIEMLTEEVNLMNMTNMDFESVKSEPVDAASADFCLVLVDGGEFIELPDRWPWKDRQHDKNIVFLTDPTKRVWPVLLHRKQHIAVLSTGWKDFSAANMLKPGDECVFHALKRREYSVDIRRKAE